MIAFPGLSPRPGSAHHLGEHIEGGLPRQIPAGVQAQIGVQHAHQRNVGEIQSLGNHLGAKEHGNVFLLEVFQNFFVCIHGAYRVSVHPVGLHVGEKELQLLLHPLGTGANGFQRPPHSGSAPAPAGKSRSSGTSAGCWLL